MKERLIALFLEVHRNRAVVAGRLEFFVGQTRAWLRLGTILDDAVASLQGHPILSKEDLG